MKDNAFAGQRVLVTGHTGFKGSWLTAWLLELGAEVAGFSDAVPTSPAHFEALGMGNRIRDLRGDVRDAGAVSRAIEDFAPDIVFHLAAQALVRPSYDNPVQTFEVNTLGTLYVLEAIRHAPSVKAVVCITSDKAYRNDEWVWGYRETDHLGGEDPYSASKGCAELVARSYFGSFFKEGPRCATTRAGNVIGGGDWAVDRIVPDCARAWSAGRPVEIRSPHATRPWQHVLEPLSGYLWLGAHLLHNMSAPLPVSGEAFNFGPAADVNNTVSEVADELGKHWPGFACVMDRAGQAGRKECTLLKLCCDKALATLRWQATMAFPDTIRMTAEWYKRYYELAATTQGAALQQGVHELTVGQIREYIGFARQRNLPWSHHALAL